MTIVRKFRAMIVSASLVAVMMMGLIPAAHAGGTGGFDNDSSSAFGGPGGKAAPSLNLGICLNVVLSSCDSVASGNSGGGPGGGAESKSS